MRAVSTDLWISLSLTPAPLPFRSQLLARNQKETLLDNVKFYEKNEDYYKQKSLGAGIHFQYSFKIGHVVLAFA